MPYISYFIMLIMTVSSGTPFMARLSDQLRYFINKISEDSTSRWCCQCTRSPQRTSTRSWKAFVYRARSLVTTPSSDIACTATAKLGLAPRKKGNTRYFIRFTHVWSFLSL